MSTECRILNGICRLLYYKEYKKFTSACNLKKVQTRYLMKLLKQNSGTVYGRKYGFSNIQSYEDFAKQVPLTTYEDYEPYIQAAASGKEQVLTKEKIRLFELTSGSSGGKKLIPYTKTLKQEFQRGIKPWLYDIYKNIKDVDTGKSYWSITPVTAGKSYTKSGIPVGFEEDAEYFGVIEQKIMRRLFVVDGSVKFVKDMQEFYEKTAQKLLGSGKLTLISVWNPTFLILLCDFICDNKTALAGQMPDENRQMFLDAAAQKRFDKIFPDLKIISCWADGSAAYYIDKVKKYFPGVYIQPKGLLATECFMSFPLVGEEGARLGIYSHFFEFRRLADGEIVTADGLSVGEYELIVTTGGGFYRYCIGDIVEVLAVYPDAPPRIKFLRRKGICSDLFGEKLTEEFVKNVCKNLGISSCFSLLAPEKTHYCLYTTAEQITSEMLDDALRESYHYNYCRQLGQLKAARVVTVAGNPLQVYIERMAADGMRLGDIKPAYLSKKSGWGEYFDGCARFSKKN